MARSTGGRAVVELLAPVGNRDHLVAAVSAGADAVYFGGPKYSARAYAGNFSLSELQEAIDYCHAYGVKVYLAINTLFKEDELEEAYRYALEMWNSGADALIVTDPGLMHRLRFHPMIERHASTQCSIHHPWEASFYARQGIKRAILARELQQDEITRISKVIESEIFIHGALCISYSGKCLMSSARGERSGNRGRCAQPCRLKCRVQVGASVSEEGHLLSPKDLQSFPYLDTVIQAGVHSLKIEGRMRSAAYVFETVKLYRAVLNGEKADPQKLYTSFCREGYHPGYFFKKPDHDLMATHLAKHTGVLLGTGGDVIKLQTDIAVGDGITNLESGFSLERIVRANQVVKQAYAGDLVEIYPKKYQQGDLLFKNHDQAHQQEIAERLSKPYARPVQIPVQVRFEAGKPLHIAWGEMKVQGAVVQLARNAPLSEDRVRKALEKRADTPFELQVTFTQFESGFLPVSQLNAVRRLCVEKLEQEAQIRRSERQHVERTTLKPAHPFQDLVIVRKGEQLRQLTSGFTAVLDPFMRDPGCLKRRDVEQYERPCLIFIPSVLRENVDEVLKWINRLKHVIGIYTSNVAMLSRYEGIKIGDYKLNLMNSDGLSFYPIDAAVPSEELNRRELSMLAHKERFIPLLYGRLEMMITDYCLSKQGEPCQTTCLEPVTLIDRYAERSPILHDVYCRSHVYNSKIKNLLDRRQAFEEMGYRSFVVEFTTEDGTTVAKVLEALAGGEPYLSPDFTRGHYLRGVL